MKRLNRAALWNVTVKSHTIRDTLMKQYRWLSGDLQPEHKKTKSCTRMCPTTDIDSQPSERDWGSYRSSAWVPTNRRAIKMGGKFSTITALYAVWRRILMLKLIFLCRETIFLASPCKTCFQAYANSEGPDQPAQMHRLIRAVAAH